MNLRYMRRALALGSLVVLSACSGTGTGGGLFGGNGACQPGTDVTLANPRQGQFVSSNIGQVEIVANGNANTLYNTSGQWYVTLTSGFTTINGGNLVPFSDPGGYHPYGSDFYYTSSFGNLPTNATWTVSLVWSNQGCSPASIGSFST